MRVIKSGAGPLRAEIRNFTPGPKAAPPLSLTPVEDPALEALRRRAQAAEARVAELETELDTAPAKLDQVEKDALARGRVEGAKQAEDWRAAHLAKLTQTADAALKAVEDDLVSTERLAVKIAETSLDRVLGDTGAYPDLLKRMIAHQLTALRDQTVLRIEVSSRDFDRPALQSLIDALARPDLEVGASSELAAGGCRLKVRLGEIEIGLDQQWGALSAALSALAAPPASRP